MIVNEKCDIFSYDHYLYINVYNIHNECYQKCYVLSQYFIRYRICEMFDKRSANVFKGKIKIVTRKQTLS